MYEHLTYEAVLRRMLNRIDEWARDRGISVDTREGSLIRTALSPAALELLQMYIELDQVLNESFADTETRDFLIRRCAERAIFVEPATCAVRRGEFNIDIPIGSRFSLNKLNYIAVEKISDGVFQMRCEATGNIGNHESGALIPIDYISGLTTAMLTDVLIPGEDEEGTEHLRQRYFNSLRSQAFGGNVADYKEKVNAIPGVGGVKVYRAWNGGIRPASFVPPAVFDAWLDNPGDSLPPEISKWLTAVSVAARDGLLTVGGTVRLVIIDSTFLKPSDLLIETVQTAIDPVENHSEGLGIAPIGHFVTVTGVDETEVNIETHITFENGWDWESVRFYVEEAVDQYFNELSQRWADSERIIVRISQIETRLLNLTGILDIQFTTLNGGIQNLPMDSNNIPIRGSISSA